jgi:hypothetical protein
MSLRSWEIYVGKRVSQYSLDGRWGGPHSLDSVEKRIIYATIRNWACLPVGTTLGDLSDIWFPLYSTAELIVHMF